MKSKRVLKSLSFLFVGVLLTMSLTGCLGGATLAITITPDPIVFTVDDTSEEVEVQFKLSGFGKLTLNDMIVQVVGETVYEVETVEIDKEVWAIPFLPSHEETVTLDLSAVLGDYVYADFEGEDYSLVITVTGDTDVVAEATISFQ